VVVVVVVVVMVVVVGKHCLVTMSMWYVSEGK